MSHGAFTNNFLKTKHTWSGILPLLKSKIRVCLLGSIQKGYFSEKKWRNFLVSLERLWSQLKITLVWVTVRPWDGLRGWGQNICPSPSIKSLGSWCRKSACTDFMKSLKPWQRGEVLVQPQKAGYGPEVKRKGAASLPWDCDNHVNVIRDNDWQNLIK